MIYLQLILAFNIGDFDFLVTEHHKRNFSGHLFVSAQKGFVTVSRVTNLAALKMSLELLTFGTGVLADLTHVLEFLARKACTSKGD
jgi:hypothetical protein